MGIVEIIVILAVALIVIPPENLPDVMRAAGKILRELRLASNLVVRELGGALDQPSDPEATRPINSMKPSVHAASSNIAQSTAPADAAAPLTPPSAESSDATTASSSSTAESTTTAAVPKASE